MKNSGTVLLCAFLLAACAVDRNNAAPQVQLDESSASADLQACSYTDAYAQLDPDSIQIQNLLLEFVPDALDQDTLIQASTDVVLATVCSIEGGSTVHEIKHKIVLPYTYGTLTILKSLKGDLSAGQTIHFTRSGGIIAYEEYLQTLEPSQRNAVASVTEKPAYIKQKVSEDIDIEVGKSYLVYLSDDSYQVKPDAYAILGYQGGLREVRAARDLQITPETPFSEIEVYQFIDNSWDPLTLIFTDSSQ